MSDQRKALIRVCAKCQRVFIFYKMCPHCGFAHYGAIWAIGFWRTMQDLVITPFTQPNDKEVIEWS